MKIPATKPEHFSFPLHYRQINVGAIHLNSLAQQVPTTQSSHNAQVHWQSCINIQALMSDAINGPKAGSHRPLIHPQTSVRQWKKKKKSLLLCFGEEWDSNLQSHGTGPCWKFLSVTTSLRSALLSSHSLKLPTTMTVTAWAKVVGTLHLMLCFLSALQ